MKKGVYLNPMDIFHGKYKEEKKQTNKQKKKHGIKEVKKSRSSPFHQPIYGPESGQKTTSEIKIGS